MYLSLDGASNISFSNFINCIYIAENNNEQCIVVVIKLRNVPFHRKKIYIHILLDFSLTVRAAPYECVIRTSQP